MACRDAPNFESYIRARLDWDTEAGDAVAALSKDTSLADAVALAIESLPERDAEQLELLAAQFEPYCEWVEEWEPAGWSMMKGHNRVSVYSPKSHDWGGSADRYPSVEVIAAAAGFESVELDAVIFPGEPESKVPDRVQSIFYAVR